MNRVWHKLMKKICFLFAYVFSIWTNFLISYNSDVISNRKSEITIHESIDSIWLEICEDISQQQSSDSKLKNWIFQTSSTFLYIIEQQRIADERFQAEQQNTMWFVQSEISSSSATSYEWNWSSIENKFRCSNKTQ